MIRQSSNHLKLTKKQTKMKKLLLILTGASLALMLGSCSSSKTMSKNAIAFPGMTVSRTDYSLSKDVSAEIEVKEFTTFFKLIRSAKAVGEAKNETRQGIVSGYNLDPAAQIAVYRLLDANPKFDYLTNIRVQKEFTSKWKFLFTSYSTKIKVTAKGITLNTEK